MRRWMLVAVLGAVVAVAAGRAGMAQARPLHPLPQPVVGNIAAAGGSVYMLGGADSTGIVDRTSFRYDPIANAWVDIGVPLPNITRGRSAVASTGQHIWVFGRDANGRRWFEHFAARVPGWLSRDITNQPARPPVVADLHKHIWFFNTLVRRGHSAVKPAIWEYDPSPANK